MRHICLLACVILFPVAALAGPSDFQTGPVIDGFGPKAVVAEAQTLPDDITFKVAFDTAKASEGDALNRTLESAARFLNMHAAAGVDPENIRLAVVTHGGAAFDMLHAEAYADRHEGRTNPNVALIAALTDRNVRIILCGQTAAYRDIAKDDLLPGVELALSAMTAHAQLQQDGYTLNPF